MLKSKIEKNHVKGSQVCWAAVGRHQSIQSDNSSKMSFACTRPHLLTSEVQHCLTDTERVGHLYFFRGTALNCWTSLNTTAPRTACVHSQIRVRLYLLHLAELVALMSHCFTGCCVERDRNRHASGEEKDTSCHDSLHTNLHLILTHSTNTYT